MAKKDRQETQRRVKEDLASNKAETEQFVAARERERDAATARSGALSADVTENWRNLAATGGYDPSQVDTMRAAATKEVAPSYDPTQLEKLRGVGGEMMEGGGFDPAQVAKVRGGYESLSTYGGITPDEEGKMTRAATRGVGSLYDVMGQELARKRAITGGYGGGGETAKMAREMANKQAEAVTGAGSEIAKLRQTGRIEGLRGLGTTEEAIASGRRGAYTTTTGLETDAARAAQTDEANRINSANLLARIESDIASGKRAGASGLTTTYGLSLDERVNLGKEILQRIQMGQQASQADMAILQDLSKQPGVFDNIVKLVAAGAGVAGAVMTGGASLIPGAAMKGLGGGVTNPPIPSRVPWN